MWEISHTCPSTMHFGSFSFFIIVIFLVMYYKMHQYIHTVNIIKQSSYLKAFNEFTCD